MSSCLTRKRDITGELRPGDKDREPVVASQFVDGVPVLGED